MNRTRQGQKFVVDINMLTATCTFFCTRSNVHTCNFLCYPKTLRAIISKNFISVYDTSLVKYRMYNKMYTRTKMLSKGVYKIFYIWPLVKNSEKYRGNKPVNNNILWFYCLDNVARHPVYLKARIHLGRRDFLSIYVTTHIKCVFGPGTRKKQYVKKKCMLLFYFIQF